MAPPDVGLWDMDMPYGFQRFLERQESNAIIHNILRGTAHPSPQEQQYDFHMCKTTRAEALHKTETSKKQQHSKDLGQGKLRPQQICL